MTPSQTSGEVQDRIFELLGRAKTFTEIAEDLGITWEQAMPLIRKVIDERGNPNLIASREIRERIARIRF